MLRTPGMLYQKQEEGKISNLYSIEFVNKTFKELPIELKLIEPKGEIRLVDGQSIMVHKESVGKSSFFLVINANEVKKVSTPVVVEVWSDGKLIETMNSKFNGPVYMNIDKEASEPEKEHEDALKDKKESD
jgi:hypothetical protein